MPPPAPKGMTNSTSLVGTQPADWEEEPAEEEVPELAAPEVVGVLLPPQAARERVSAAAKAREKNLFMADFLSFHFFI